MKADTEYTVTGRDASATNTNEGRLRLNRSVGGGR